MPARCWAWIACRRHGETANCRAGAESNGGRSRMSSSAAGVRRTPSPRLLAHAELCLVVLAWSGTYIATKEALRQVEPNTLALLRNLIAGLALGLCLLRSPRRGVARADLPLLSLLGLTGITLFYALQHIGLRSTGATDAAILGATSPIFIVLLSALLLRQRLGPSVRAGVVVASVGSAVLILGGGNSLRLGPQALWGDALILATSLSWAVYTIYGARLVGRYPPLVTTTWTTLLGALFLLPLALPELLAHGWPSISLHVWLLILYLALLSSAYAYLAWYRALRVLPASQVGAYLYVRPLLTALLAMPLLGERLTIYTAIGGVLIVAGVWLTTRRGR